MNTWGLLYPPQITAAMTGGVQNPFTPGSGPFDMSGEDITNIGAVVAGSVTATTVTATTSLTAATVNAGVINTGVINNGGYNVKVNGGIVHWTKYMSTSGFAYAPLPYPLPVDCLPPGTSAVPVSFPADFFDVGSGYEIMITGRWVGDPVFVDALKFEFLVGPIASTIQAQVYITATLPAQTYTFTTTFRGMIQSTGAFGTQFIEAMTSYQLDVPGGGVVMVEKNMFSPGFDTTVAQSWNVKANPTTFGAVDPSLEILQASVTLW
jgi:hypothetical protein